MSEYGNLVYGGVNSSTYNIYVVNVNDDDMPERDYDTYSIPGKSRDIHFDNGRYKNIDRIYKCVAISSGILRADAAANAFISRLMPLRGYQRIEDTIHDDYYKLGEFRGGTEIEYSAEKNIAVFELTFDCDGRKFLTSGEKSITLSSGANSITNPGTENALPQFMVVGNGYVEISNRRITVADNPGTMVIDCELGDAYSQSAHTNYNQYITVTGDGQFPFLIPGANTITVSGFTSRKVIPRWSRL